MSDLIDAAAELWTSSENEGTGKSSVQKKNTAFQSRHGSQRRHHRRARCRRVGVLALSSRRRRETIVVRVYVLFATISRRRFPQSRFSVTEERPTNAKFKTRRRPARTFSAQFVSHSRTCWTFRKTGRTGDSLGRGVYTEITFSASPRRDVLLLSMKRLLRSTRRHLWPFVHASRPHDTAAVVLESPESFTRIRVRTKTSECVTGTRR